MAAGEILPPHGSRARYYRGCKCPKCTNSNTVYQRGYRDQLRGPALDTYVRQRTTSTARRARTPHGRVIEWTEPELPY